MSIRESMINNSEDYHFAWDPRQMIHISPKQQCYIKWYKTHHGDDMEHMYPVSTEIQREFDYHWVVYHDGHLHGPVKYPPIEREETDFTLMKGEQVFYTTAAVADYFYRWWMDPDFQGLPETRKQKAYKEWLKHKYTGLDTANMANYRPTLKEMREFDEEYVRMYNVDTVLHPVRFVKTTNVKLETYGYYADYHFAWSSRYVLNEWNPKYYVRPGTTMKQTTFYRWVEAKHLILDGLSEETLARFDAWWYWMSVAHRETKPAIVKYEPVCARPSKYEDMYNGGYGAPACFTTKQYKEDIRATMHKQDESHSDEDDTWLIDNPDNEESESTAYDSSFFNDCYSDTDLIHDGSSDESYWIMNDSNDEAESD